MLNVKTISPLLKCLSCERSACTHGNRIWILYIVLLRPKCSYNTCPRIHTLVLCQVIFTMPILLFAYQFRIHSLSLIMRKYQMQNEKHSLKTFFKHVNFTIFFTIFKRHTIKCTQSKKQKGNYN